MPNIAGDCINCMNDKGVCGVLPIEEVARNVSAGCLCLTGCPKPWGLGKRGTVSAERYYCGDLAREG
jgi:hypothetical protein